jgi:hypothetical protein
LLADYVVALLKNNRPKKELQKLCIDQLYDFLGEGKAFYTWRTSYLVCTALFSANPVLIS